MIDGSEKRNRQLAFELQNSHVCGKRSKYYVCYLILCIFKFYEYLILSYRYFRLHVIFQVILEYF